MKKYLLIFLLISMISIGAGNVQEVQFTIDADKNKALMNTSVLVDCDRFCSGLNWRNPEGSRVLSVADGSGELDPDISGDKIEIKGERSRGRDNRTVRIALRKDKDAEEVYSGLYQRHFSIPSFNGVRTSGILTNPDLISGRTGFGFESSYSGREMRFRGEGPTNIRVKFGSGNKTEYFEFFGGSFSGNEDSYEVPVGTLGTLQRFQRFPVAVMEDEAYNSSVNGWSAGEYVGGSIKIRNPESAGDDFVPVLGHEVVHGLNDRILNWDRTSSSYFDEGTAKYIESLIRKKRYNQGSTERKPSEIFGDPVFFREDGKRYRNPSRGDKEQLWSYYQNDREFMSGWNAMEADPDRRSFGYAFSELIIKNYVSRNNSSIKELYQDLEVNRRVDSRDEKWGIYSQYLDMSPCEYDSRKRFENCLERINSYDYPVYSASPERNQGELEIMKLEIPNRTETKNKNIDLGVRKSGERFKLAEFLTGFIDYLGSLLS